MMDIENEDLILLGETQEESAEYRTAVQVERFPRFFRDEAIAFFLSAHLRQGTQIDNLQTEPIRGIHVLHGLSAN